VNKLAELSLSIGNLARKLSLKLQFSLVVDAARIDIGAQSSGRRCLANFDTQNFCIPQKLNQKIGKNKFTPLQRKRVVLKAKTKWLHKEKTTKITFEFNGIIV